MELAINRTPDQIAAEINLKKEETKRIVIYNSIEIGRKLTEAKELVPPGEWTKWLAEKVDYKKSTANNLMRIFKEYGADQLSMIGSNTAKEIYDKLDYSKAVILLGTTEEEKKEILTNNNVEDMSSRELKKLRDELKKANEDKEKAKKELEDYKNKPNEELEKANKEIEELKRSKEAGNNIAKKRIEQLEEKIQANKKEAEEAKAEVERLKSSSSKVDEEIAGLREYIEQLESKPVEVTGNLDKNNEMEEEIEKLKKDKEELIKSNKEKVQKLLKEKENLEKQLSEKENVEVDDSISRYAIYFTEVADKFDKLLGALDQIKDNSIKSEYTEATRQLIIMMQDKLK